ncbi:MAG: hypothetical protein HS113_15950 [Verrucomicrobiales bacterium]|nr:hypothetical protein [Verrucomicrobiales bacterium]
MASKPGTTVLNESVAFKRSKDQVSLCYGTATSGQIVRCYSNAISAVPEPLCAELRLVLEAVGSTSIPRGQES